MFRFAQHDTLLILLNSSVLLSKVGQSATVVVHLGLPRVGAGTSRDV
jgi:hypothetical protein